MSPIASKEAPVSDQVAVAGNKLFELFAACAADPDSVSAGHAANDALDELDALLALKGNL